MARLEYVGVHLIDMPCSVTGITVKVDADTYCILINARLSRDAQIRAYDHEIQHIDSGDFDHMVTVDQLECLRHAG